MAAVMANPHTHVLLLEGLFLGNKNLGYECRKRQEHPFDRQPPPTYENPPEYVVMLILELRLGDYLRGYIVTLALGTNHKPISSYKLIL